MKTDFPCELEKVGNVVTSLQSYSWRSDLKKIVILEAGSTFEEHTKEGFITKFTITSFVPCERYEFDMENENMSGHWTGIFSYQDGKTMVEFTENVIAKKWFMKPFVSMYLKKQQAIFVSDLRRELEKLAHDKRWDYYAKEIITIAVYGDNREIIEDCLENLEPFIDEVFPEVEAIDFCDVDCMDLVVSELLE